MLPFNIFENITNLNYFPKFYLNFHLHIFTSIYDDENACNQTTNFFVVFFLYFFFNQIESKKMHTFEKQK